MDVVQEWACNSDNGWSGGSLKRIATTAYKKSQITAVRTEKKAIHVFYQDADNRLAGVVYVSGPGWLSVVESTKTISTDWPLIDALGSGLSVVNYPRVEIDQNVKWS